MTHTKQVAGTATVAAGKNIRSVLSKMKMTRSLNGHTE